jgi:adenosylhomocysteine nucleosidase
MIGITFALPSESSYLVRQLRYAEDVDNLLIGKIGKREIAIVHTGVGSKNCNARLEILLHKARPDFVITSGFAGAVTEDLHVGDLILAENFSNRTLLDLAREILRERHAKAVRLFTSTSVIDSVSERDRIARESGAAAVDMETGAIVAICAAHDMPLLSLRAITDAPKEQFPAPPDVLFDIEHQQTRYGRLFGYLLRHPAAIPRLLRFSREIKQVSAKLADAVVALVDGL